MHCDVCRDAMLDELYGLLDPAESAALAAHVAECPACTAEWAKAKADQSLLAKASTASFPALVFSPPTVTSVVPSTVVVPDPVEPLRKTARQTWIGWAVAATVVLAAAGTLGPTVRTLTTHLAYSSELASARRELQTLNDAHQIAKNRYDEAVVRASKAVFDAKEVHDEVVTQWVNAETAAAAARPFAVTVRGPAAAIPGAPNDYAVAAVNDENRTVASSFVAVLRNQSGKEYFQTTAESANGREATIRIPASVWTGVPANESLTLAVTATNKSTGQTSELAEPVRVLAPVYSTVLATDAPLYRPGDLVRFRSLTLDRSRFLPPDRDLNLCYALIGPNGQIVPGSTVTGSTRLETVADDGRILRPILGPDGKPLRGIGCGELRLPARVGGQYKVAVFELPYGWTSTLPPAGAVPLATRSILVQPYAAHKWSKSLTYDARTYGPGEPVSARLTVFDQGQPVRNAVLQVSAVADGRALPTLDHSPTTDAAGTATIKLTLPQAGATTASLTVGVLGSNHQETIVRPIPLVPRSMNVEFFPEGGDLVAGVPNRVYIRGVLPDGRPADFAGTISDGTTDVATVRSETDADEPGANRGIGIASFTPQAGKTYTLNLNRPIGLTTMTAKLPPVKADGVALSIPDGVFAADEPIRLTVSSPQARRLVIGAYTRGSPVAHTAVNVDAGKTVPVVLTPDAAAPEGVTRITVFEEPADGTPGWKELRPVAERLVFRNSPRRLDLNVRVTLNATTDGVAPSPATYLPGQALAFDVSARTEAGAPSAAILYASIVDETLFAASDDTTDRALPTHFLLNGEVQNPDALERADFLLSSHPKAGAALDRLLGTQGWRRFAEQNPAEFRKTAKPDDADRLLLAVGSTAPITPDYKPAVQRAMQIYRPKYETALARLETAEAALDASKFESEHARAVSTAASRIQPAATRFNQAAKEIRLARGDEDERSGNLFAALFLAGVAAILLLVRFTVMRHSPERGLVLKTAVILLSLLGFLGIVQAVLSATEESHTITSVPWTPNPGSRPMASAAGITTDRPGGTPNARLTQEGGSNARATAFNAKPAPPVDTGHGIILEPDRWNAVAPRPAPSSPYESLRAERSEQLKNRITEAAPNSEALATAVSAHPPFIIREFAHGNATGDGRQDFSEIVYWNPVIVVPGDGLSIPFGFQLNDSVTSYRVTVAGHSPDGRLGHTTTRIRVQKPLAADIKVPPVVTMGDTVQAMTSVKATGIAAQPKLYLRGRGVQVHSPKELEDRIVPLASDGGARRPIRVTTTAPGPAELQLWANDHSGTRLRDIVARPMLVEPAGYPAAGTASAVVNGTVTLRVPLPPERVKGTLSLTVSAYPNPLADLEAGIAGIAKAPAACFEQAASSSYPHMLLLQWLEAANRDHPRAASLAEAARQALPGGYRNLLRYECDGPGKKQGFEWFGGKAPPHESLTAYGLLHFTDLQSVHAIDADVIDRTREYLLSRRDGQGGFQRDDRARDSFGRAPTVVANAFIVWALSEADRIQGRQTDLLREREAIAAEAVKSNDSYRLALAALATPHSTTLLDRLATRQAANGSVPGAETSITHSAGPDLLTETTALAVLAWTRAGSHYASHANKGLMYLAERRQPGGTFGATQATVLALKAITEAARSQPRPHPNESVNVFINDNPVGTISLAKSGTLAVAEAEKWFVTGPASVRVETIAKVSIPVTVEWSCRTNKPPANSPTANLNCSVALSSRELTEGDSVRLDVSIANTAKRVRGMIVATIGLPAGLTVPTDAKQLNDMVLQSANGPGLAYWEQRGRDLVLYWRSIPSDQPATLSLDLIAAYPGEYRGGGSQIAPYYDPDARVWLPGFAVTIAPR
jgi:hypothetical protein